MAGLQAGSRGFSTMRLARISGRLRSPTTGRLRNIPAIRRSMPTGRMRSGGRSMRAGACGRMSQLMRLAFRHKLVDGDAVALLLWRPERIGPGRARYATTVQLIDPDRLSNPQQQYDQKHLRGGVEIDDDGAAKAYWIRRAHLGDWYNADESVRWDRIARETPWGRPLVVHDFDPDRAGQHRGGAGVLTPV